MIYMPCSYGDGWKRDRGVRRRSRFLAWRDECVFDEHESYDKAEMKGITGVIKLIHHWSAGYFMLAFQPFAAAQSCP